MPAVPDHFARCSEITRKGPSLIHSLKQSIQIEPKKFLILQKSNKVLVLDVRTYPDSPGSHTWIRHIDLTGKFAIQAGWIQQPGRKILLIVDKDYQAEEAPLQLHRVGFDRITGFLEGGLL